MEATSLTPASQKGKRKKEETIYLHEDKGSLAVAASFFFL